LLSCPTHASSRTHVRTMRNLDRLAARPPPSLGRGSRTAVSAALASVARLWGSQKLSPIARGPPRARRKEYPMKRIASAVAAVALTAAPVIAGSTGTANAAPAPGADVSAQECGLNQLEQSYTNCRGYPHIVSITYMDSTTKSTGSVLACA